jgi:hypothetical protein
VPDASVQHDPEGWRQGSLLPAGVTPPSLFWAHPGAQASRQARSAVKAAARNGDVDGFIHAERAVKERERAVVVSHTCDLLKDGERMPQVELARVFETTSSAVVAEAQRLGSARYFRLDGHDEGPALVLDYSWRTFIDKGFIEVHQPDNTLVRSPERRAALARWLGRRYARPVLEDEDVVTVADPIRLRWRQLTEEDPDAAVAYSTEFVEFRFRRETSGELTMYVLSARAEPDPILALEVVSILREALAPYHATVRFADVFSYHHFTKADELTTIQIDLEWASHDEGVASGGLPT